MRPIVLLRRFLLPPYVITVLAYLKFGAKVSHRAEVELSSLLWLGKGVVVKPRAKIKASEGPISIGSGTTIGEGAVIGGHIHGVMIGEHCTIGSAVTIMGVNYRYDRIDIPIREQGLVSKGPIKIGDRVEIGAGAVILDASEIGSGAVIAPRAVVSGRIASQ
ncbi:MAG: acyltransferase [Sphingobium sp.]|uniref:acyltransferase n=1 Tax=Sphingobium sp. TaxID=1912891 RepID=UPI0029AA5381|nr:acyltransferase [Sphingobium sp.]MDX3908921.1 acyltransferase [Sphingobium sp.]